MLRRLPAVGPVVAIVAAALGCMSPTLPLPPPAIPSVLQGPDADHVRLASGCGGVESNAIVIIVNENTAVPGDQAVSGSMADGCGKWDAIVYAHSGDVLHVTEEVGTIGSPPTVVQVK
jgi:hypothetical protein